jgi:hypothetical protein
MTELATGFTVRDYEAALAAQDRDRIANALHKRLTERYIQPVTDPKHKHGFTMMAISCLMIEALESFRQGWRDTNERGKGKAAFCYFFDNNDRFKDFRGHSQQFYKNVQCGILHQAETTGGWRITRKATAPLFDSGSLTINVECFLKNLSLVLADFCAELKTADWDSLDWKHVRTKMKALCENCRAPTASIAPTR